MTDIIDMANTKPADLSVSIAPRQSTAQGAAAGGVNKQPVREAIIRAAELARGAEEHARGRQHAKGKHTARERLDLLFDTDTFQEIDHDNEPLIRKGVFVMAGGSPQETHTDKTGKARKRKMRVSVFSYQTSLDFDVLTSTDSQMK